MRRSLLIACLSFALLAPPVAADTHEASADRTRLDQLFQDLKRERNETAARRIAERIREEWLSAGGATADLLIGWAREAAEEEKFHVALDLLDQAVVLYPDYVESWNNRAMVYVMMNDYSRAMADLSRVLSIEPRHFGAMNGLAGILRATGREERAVEVYRRLLEVYPMQRSAQRALMRMTDRHADDRL